MKNNIKRYIKQVDKELYLPHKIKRNIRAELLAEIYGRLDDGEELDSILTSIGTPQEFAEELEANYGNEFMQFKRESILKLIIYTVIAFGVSALVIYSAIIIIYPQYILPTIIGGANGNTSIFIAYKWSAKNLIIGLIVQVIILIFVVLKMIKTFNFIKNKKGMPKKRRNHNET